MITNQDFGSAIDAAKRGERISREGWNGKNMFVFMRPGDILNIDDVIDKVQSLPLSVKNFFASKDSQEMPSERGLARVKFTPYLCMYPADGSIVNGWLASQTDMLAEDWCILES